MRTWSWKYSRWRSGTTAQQGWTWIGRPAVRGELERARLAERGDAQEPGDPLAAGDVGLQAVDRASLEHPLEVRQRVAVLAGSDLHPRRCPVADQAQTLEVVRADRLLEPAHIEALGGLEREPQRLLAAERAVRVDEQLRVVADRLACDLDALEVALGFAADLHLDPRDALLDPAAELLGEPLDRDRR